MNSVVERLRILAPFTLAVGIWLAPIPEGLTKEAWHLFAIFAAAIFAVIIMSAVVVRIWNDTKSLDSHDLTELKG